jgi:hypothetical protein
MRPLTEYIANFSDVHDQSWIVTSTAHCMENEARHWPVSEDRRSPLSPLAFLVRSHTAHVPVYVRPKSMAMMISGSHCCSPSESGGSAWPIAGIWPSSSDDCELDMTAITLSRGGGLHMQKGKSFEISIFSARA